MHDGEIEKRFFIMFIQIFGSMLVLVSFILVQAKKLTPDSQIYLLLNSIGSGLLAFDALRDAQWGISTFRRLLGYRINSRSYKKFKKIII